MCGSTKYYFVLFPTQDGPRIIDSGRHGNQYQLLNEHPNAKKGKPQQG